MGLFLFLGKLWNGLLLEEQRAETIKEGWHYNELENGYSECKDCFDLSAGFYIEGLTPLTCNSLKTCLYCHSMP